MRVTLRQLGNLQKEAEQNRVDFARALWLATDDVGFALQRLERQDVERSTLRRAKQMAKTWRKTTKPRRPEDLKPGQTPEAFVFNRSRVFAVYLARGGQNRAVRAGALLIPVGRARNLKLRIGQSRRELIYEATKKFGPLVPIKTKDGKMALGIVTPMKSGRNKVEPLFLLRREARVAKLFTPVPIYQRFVKRIQPRWVAIVTERFNGIGRGGRANSQVTTNYDVKQSRKLDGLTVASASQGLVR